MRITGEFGFRLRGVATATSSAQRWRGLMARKPRPMMLSTSMVHGFWLRQTLWLVGIDSRLAVTEIRLLRRRRLAWLRGATWILEIPHGGSLPAVGERLAFYPDDGEADHHARTSLPVRHTHRQPG